MPGEQGLPTVPESRPIWLEQLKVALEGIQTPEDNQQLVGLHTPCCRSDTNLLLYLCVVP